MNVLSTTGQVLRTKRDAELHEAAALAAAEVAAADLKGRTEVVAATAAGPSRPGVARREKPVPDTR